VYRSAEIVRNDLVKRCLDDMLLADSIDPTMLAILSAFLKSLFAFRCIRRIEMVSVMVSATRSSHHAPVQPAVCVSWRERSTPELDLGPKFLARVLLLYSPMTSQKRDGSHTNALEFRQSHATQA